MANTGECFEGCQQRPRFCKALNPEKREATTAHSPSRLFSAVSAFASLPCRNSCRKSVHCGPAALAACCSCRRQGATILHKVARAPTGSHDPAQGSQPPRGRGDYPTQLHPASGNGVCLQGAARRLCGHPVCECCVGPGRRADAVLPVLTRRPEQGNCQFPLQSTSAPKRSAPSVRVKPKCPSPDRPIAPDLGGRVRKKWGPGG